MPSVPAAGLLPRWLARVVLLVKGAACRDLSSPASYWRSRHAGAARLRAADCRVPLLVPTFMERMGPRLAPLRPPPRPPGARRRWSAFSPSSRSRCRSFPIRSGRSSRPTRRGAVAELIVDDIAVPADAGVISLRVRRVGRRTCSPGPTRRARATTFYRVYRGSLANTSRTWCASCAASTAASLRAETLTTTREQHYVDPAPPPDAVYRVGVAANWLDDDRPRRRVRDQPPGSASRAGSFSCPTGQSRARASSASSRAREAPPPARAARCRRSSRESTVE